MEKIAKEQNKTLGIKKNEDLKEFVQDNRQVKKNEEKTENPLDISSEKAYNTKA